MCAISIFVISSVSFRRGHTTLCPCNCGSQVTLGYTRQTHTGANHRSHLLRRTDFELQRRKYHQQSCVYCWSQNILRFTDVCSTVIFSHTVDCQVSILHLSFFSGTFPTALGHVILGSGWPVALQAMWMFCFSSAINRLVENKSLGAASQQARGDVFSWQWNAQRISCLAKYK